MFLSYKKLNAFFFFLEKKQQSNIYFTRDRRVIPLKIKIKKQKKNHVDKGNMQPKCLMEEKNHYSIESITDTLEEGTNQELDIFIFFLARKEK